MNEENKLTEEDIRVLLGLSENSLENAEVRVPVKVEIKPQSPKTENPAKYYNKVKHQVNGGILSWILNIAKTLGLFILIFTFSFGVLNYPALILKARYFWEVQQQKKDWSTKVAPTILPTSNESFLIIPKIAVKAPIAWNIPNEQTLPALESGVAHFAGTALPGQAGNIFISGHSSYYWWNEGGYKEVFALLENVNIGDKITIDYKGTIYNYEVFDKKVVKPDNLEVLNQSNDKILSLMTCVPVGTNLNRLIVIAKQI